jgi:L-lactate dehydrogenase complex protein LldG
MSIATVSRKQILNRVRAATRNSTAAEAASSYATLPRSYVGRGLMNLEECVDRMAERLREYDAEVVECAPNELAEAIRAQLAANGRRKFVVPEGLPAEWLAEGFEWKIDHDLPAQEVEQVEGVMTACFCGVAESGTIVLHHSTMEGRRVITLLPDWHLCILRASQIVETLPEYFVRCEKPPRLVTWISGPSATADIEMTRIKGVHGPRILNVILARDEGSES